jgi:hypothetical protein
MVPSDLAIVIPVYQEKPQDFELVSLQRACTILQDRKFILVAPASIDLNNYFNLFNHFKICPYTERFDDSFFQSTKTYNRLMLDINFYSRFTAYQYILIYQTDAYIFKDELDCWTGLGYDYVGAPWIDWPVAAHWKLKNTFWKKKGYAMFGLFGSSVGNGGLSLRKVNACIRILNAAGKEIGDFKGNEDFFFAFEAPKITRSFKIAPVSKAITFSFDVNPSLLFRLNKNQLPMGCHAWHKHLEFWRHHIPV